MKHDPEGMRSQLPHLYNVLSRKRYVLPGYRQPDYVSADRLLQLDWLVVGDLHEKANDLIVFHFMKALHYDRPTFFVEKELCRVMLTSKLPPEYRTDDLHWRWPALRLVLPKDMLWFMEGFGSAWPEEGRESVAYIDVSIWNSPDGEVFVLPDGVNDEVAKLSDGKYYSGKPILLRTDSGAIEQFDQLCDENAKILISIVGSGGTPVTYISDWNNKALGDLINRELSHKTRNGLVVDKEEVFIKAQYLALNLLLYMSSTPIEYGTEQIIRKPRLEGGKGKVIPGLAKARFVGQLSQRPAFKAGGKCEVPTGRHVRPHWVSGHWKKQPHGPKHSQRRWIFVGVYHTGETEEIV